MITEEEIRARQPANPQGVPCEPYWMRMLTPSNSYTFVEIPSSFDYIRNAQRGMYGADVGIYVISAHTWGIRSAQYLVSALGAGVRYRIAYVSKFCSSYEEDDRELMVDDLKDKAWQLGFEWDAILFGDSEGADIDRTLIELIAAMPVFPGTPGILCDNGMILAYGSIENAE